MRIYSTRGENNILFEFTERKFINKIRAFRKFSQIYCKKFFKRKEKITGFYVIYTWGYSTKPPYLTTSADIAPDNHPLTFKTILDFVEKGIETYHDIYIENYVDKITITQVKKRLKYDKNFKRKHKGEYFNNLIEKVDDPYYLRSVELRFSYLPIPKIKTKKLKT